MFTGIVTQPHPPPPLPLDVAWAPGETAFESLPPCDLFHGYLREQPILHGKRRRWRGFGVPVGKFSQVLESPRGWDISRTLFTSRRWRSTGLPSLFHGIRQSIEILVLPSFCLSPSHMALSLVSYFSFLVWNFFFWGTEIGHFNKVLFQWVKRFHRARNHSKESADPTHGKA